MLDGILNHPDFWKYVSIPVVAAVVGWGTNWIAVKMTFGPLEFLGIPPYLGWQGIIPSKARKMAGILMDNTLDKLGSIQDIFDRMQPERIAEHIVATVDPQVELIVEDIIRSESPAIWEALPPALRQTIFLRVRSRLPQIVAGLLDDVGKQIGQLVDLKAVAVETLDQDKRLLNRLFQECGKDEFRFIVVSGIYFGGIFGLIQMGVWLFYQGWWVLPLFGFLVGYATNWIALNLIFRPLEPRRVGPFVVQGLFLKRQKEVAVTFCTIFTREIITIERIVDTMLNGPAGKTTQGIIRKHIRPIIDEAAGPARLPIQLAIGSRNYTQMKDMASDKALELSVAPFEDAAFNESQAVLVTEMLVERMEAMTPMEFQALLRPAFEEDELVLILLGAGLGLAAGVAQLVFVF